MQCARDQPGATDAVYLCITADSRWDRQTEDRAAFPARLVRELGLGLEPLSKYLTRAETDDSALVGLALDVLAMLTLAGRADAVAILRGYAVVTG